MILSRLFSQVQLEITISSKRVLLYQIIYFLLLHNIGESKDYSLERDKSKIQQLKRMQEVYEAVKETNPPICRKKENYG